MKTVRLISGEVAIDDRGELGFVNDFDFGGVKRFYTMRNHKRGFVRAWHGHKRESKYIMVVEGAAVVGAVPIDNWDHPSRDVEVSRFVLSAKKPSVLFVPAGYANGFMSLTEDTRLLVFSTASLEESKSDDFRFDARYWDIWNVVER